MRRQDEDSLRIFNGHDGEWLASLQNLKKKSGEALILKQIKDQPQTTTQTHLFFAPIKKNRMDILIEKSVELGIDHLTPIITAHTQNTKINLERARAQIIEAAEQCERLDVPTLHAPCKLNDLRYDGALYVGLERTAAPPLQSMTLESEIAFLIGPEGGLSDEEIKSVSDKPNTKPFSLGARIYRAETAAILCLAHRALQN